MPLLEDDRSTQNDWFEADCAQHYESQGDNGWDLRHVALAGWVTNWISKDPAHVESDHDCDIIYYPSGEGVHAQSKARDPGAALRDKAELYRVEFEVLSKKWQHDTGHLSLVSKKINHPAFLRIMGMGEPVIPLLLEVLRDRPAHWFAALRATANTNPVPEDANPSQAREAWLAWGRSKGYID